MPFFNLVQGGSIFCMLKSIIMALGFCLSRFFTASSSTKDFLTVRARSYENLVKRLLSFGSLGSCIPDCFIMISTFDGFKMSSSFCSSASLISYLNFFFFSLKCSSSSLTTYLSPLSYSIPLLLLPLITYLEIQLLCLWALV